MLQNSLASNKAYRRRIRLGKRYADSMELYARKSNQVLKRDRPQEQVQL